uniref:Regulator of G protein signaling 17 n=1 Tax=Eptatretus burgeri TaxID=7764 RepID=A0A8C4X180_EPTBU
HLYSTISRSWRVRIPTYNWPTCYKIISFQIFYTCYQDFFHIKCENVSKEEIQTWAKSFESLIETPHGLQHFHEFLRSQFSDENLLFWKACEELKAEQDQEAIARKARTIYDDYVSVFSPREHILKFIFLDAQQQIYTLMRRDCFPRFINSNFYKQLLENPQTLEESSEKPLT